MSDDGSWWDDEDDLEEFEAAWAEADRQAAMVLYGALPAVVDLSAPPPALEIHAEDLRKRLAEEPGPYEWFAAAGVTASDSGAATALWLDALASSISPLDDPGTPPEEQAAVGALLHADWLAFVLGLVRRGVGAEFSDELAFRDLETLDELEGGPVDEDDVMPTYAMAVEVLAPLWETLGVLDTDRRLTDLGAWGLPRALHQVWIEGAAVESRLDPELGTAAMEILARGPLSPEDLQRELATTKEIVDIDALRAGLYEHEDTWELPDGRLAHFGALTDGAVLTHRLTAEELELGVVDDGADLCAWSIVADEGVALLGGGELRVVRADLGGAVLPVDSQSAFVGPDGWLEGRVPGDLLGLRYVGGRLELTRVDEPAEPDEELRTALVDVLGRLVEHQRDEEYTGVFLPDVVLEVRERVPNAFSEALPPLSELIEAAGFEVNNAFAGAPYTRWNAEPAWFDEAQVLTWRDWVSAQRHWRRTGSLPPGLDVAELVRRFDAAVLSLAGYDLIFEPELEPLAEALGDPAVVHFLRAKAAEGRGDVGPWLEQLTAAHAADPSFPAAALELADLRSILGDAREAHRLYLAGGLESADGEVALLSEFLQPPPQTTGRNQPCPCGSGKKYKVCHGRTDRHPLPARAHWLWAKLRLFAEQPRQRDVMLEWGGLLAGTDPSDPEAARRALGDPTVLAFAVLAGGLLEEFVDVLGPVLPEDELALLDQWRTAPLRLLEITRIPAIGGVEATDLVTGEHLLIRDRTLGRHVQVDDLMLGWPLDDGSGELRLQTAPLSIPRLMRGPVQDLLARGADLEEIADLLAPRDPELRTTDGEELVACRARYVLADVDLAWGAMVSALDGEPDGPLHVLRGDTLLATFSRSGDEVTVEAMAVERFRHAQAMLLAAAPDARLVDESMEPFSPGLGRGQDGGESEVVLTDEDYRAVARQHEDRWLADTIPALGGMTPRQAAEQNREVLVALLRDFEVMQRRSPTPFDMDLDRIRRELGLD